MNLCISFQNDKFPITHIHNFVFNSPVEGGQITFVGDIFTNVTIICDTVEKWRDAYIYCMMRNGGMHTFII